MRTYVTTIFLVAITAFGGAHASLGGARASAFLSKRSSSPCYSFRKTSAFQFRDLVRSTSSSLNVAVDPVVIKNIATGGVLSLAGDIIAQSLTSKTDGKKTFPPQDWDKVRTAAFATFGGVYTGGVQTFIFAYLMASFDNPIQRLGMAQFFFIPLCYYPTFLFLVPTLRAGWEEKFQNDGNFLSPASSKRREALFSEVFGKIPSTLVRNWCFWLPVQFFQFSFIPSELQVTYVATFGIVWNAILSWSTSSGATEPPEKVA